MKQHFALTALSASLAISLLPHSIAVASPTIVNNLHPEDFTTEIDNPFFPLEPGTTFISEGFKGSSKLRDEFAVTHDTTVIDGVTCRVIHDKVFLHGYLQEDTLDYFVQDDKGNVWYFGEDTKELDKQGHVISTAGTWRAGVKGAKPGIIMEAHPKVNDKYFQERALPDAQDQAKVLSLSETVTVPFGKFKNALKTKEFTNLEPGNIEHKYYARWVGFLLGVVVKGGHERLALIKIVREK